MRSPDRKRISHGIIPTVERLVGTAKDLNVLLMPKEYFSSRLIRVSIFCCRNFRLHPRCCLSRRKCAMR